MKLITVLLIINSGYNSQQLMSHDGSSTKPIEYSTIEECQRAADKIEDSTRWYAQCIPIYRDK